MCYRPVKIHVIKPAHHCTVESDMKIIERFYGRKSKITNLKRFQRHFNEQELRTKFPTSILLPLLLKKRKMNYKMGHFSCNPR